VKAKERRVLQGVEDDPFLQVCSEERHEEIWAATEVRGWLLIRLTAKLWQNFNCSETPTL
jgi:hypothetical protein